ncbi:hypothetical protein HAX54_000234 [Datura stramonium]|uniref:Uncharacterized protein n=1 Tax=Datura stramonium TaxID=4076 RepID=A0ABS8T1D4_DATST|nr:hypothetical protein [Datura stramonium]
MEILEEGTVKGRERHATTEFICTKNTTSHPQEDLADPKNLINEGDAQTDLPPSNIGNRVQEIPVHGGEVGIEFPHSRLIGLVGLLEQRNPPHLLEMGIEFWCLLRHVLHCESLFMYQTLGFLLIVPKLALVDHKLDVVGGVTAATAAIYSDDEIL